VTLTSKIACRSRRGDARCDSGRVAHVGDLRAARSACAAAARFGLAELVPEHIDRPDICAALGEGEADRASESMSGARDDGRLAAEVQVHDAIVW
jgi:hypothetical protein